MSLKAELETWAAALKAYDDEDFDKALDLFSRIADSSKILTNMGLIHATLGEHEAAVDSFNAATGLDQYLAVAYFQCGVSNFLLQRYDLALKDFEEALLYLRGNQAINYEQLGLKFRLYSAEVLFNKGLCQVYMGRMQEGLQDMEEARLEKATEEHSVIDDAINDRGAGYTVFSIPVGVLYRPPENKIKNARTKDYLGKAKLVAAADANDAFTTFTGSTRLAQGFTPTGAPIDRPTSDPRDDRPINRAATATARLERSPTQITVTPATGLTKSATIGSRPNRPPGASVTPALSVRRNDGRGAPRGPNNGDPTQKAPAPPSKEPARLTEIYDDYIDGYAEEPPMPDDAKRVAAWARKAAEGPPPPPSRMGSTRPPPSTSGLSGSQSLRRKLTRRPTYGTSRGGSRINSQYDEEEEGYGSGDFDDMPFELVKIRVKLHYKDDVRGMALSPDTPWEEFLEKVTAKFGKALGSLGMKFKDEDGGRVSLRDDSDYEMAIETARESAKGKAEGKLEIWCVDE